MGKPFSYKILLNSTILALLKILLQASYFQLTPYQPPINAILSA
jgi:hypothetical protein